MDGSQVSRIQNATIDETAKAPRAPTEAEWSTTIDFLTRNLRPGISGTIADEYPLSLGRSQRHNMRVIVDDGQIIAHAVMKPIVVKTPIGVFKVAGLGSVVTSENNRNQGHSTRIIESCLSAAKDADCDLAILWTDLFDFYRRMGFELAGSEVSVLIDRDLTNGAATPTFKFVDSSKIAPDALLRLFQQHSVSSHRTTDEIRALLSIPNSRVSTAWDASGKMVAYAIEGKGADLDGYVHEWGGSSSSLVALLSHMRATQKRDLRLIAPGHAHNLIAKLESQGCEVHRGYLGMVKIINAESFFAKIHRQARALGISDLVLEDSGGVFKFGRGKNIYSTSSATDLVKLLLGPEKPTALHSFDPATSNAFEQVLPIRLWIWGWDSV